MPYRESADEILQRHARLLARLEELRPQLTALRTLEAEARTIEQAILAESPLIERRFLLPLLDKVRIASPCSQPWDAMAGDERVRFCRRCRKNVYNLSSLTREQAEALVFEREGAMCIRYYRRRDGTILTADCPSGRKRSRLMRGLIAVAVGVLGVFGVKAMPRSPPPKTFVAHPRVVELPPAPVETWLGGLASPLSPSAFTGFEILKRD
jgi:hypothetical protein